MRPPFSRIFLLDCRVLAEYSDGVIFGLASLISPFSLCPFSSIL